MTLSIPNALVDILDEAREVHERYPALYAYLATRERALDRVRSRIPHPGDSEGWLAFDAREHLRRYVLNIPPGICDLARIARQRGSATPRQPQRSTTETERSATMVAAQDHIDHERVQERLAQQAEQMQSAFPELFTHLAGRDREIRQALARFPSLADPEAWFPAGVERVITRLQALGPGVDELRQGTPRS